MIVHLLPICFITSGLSRQEGFGTHVSGSLQADEKCRGVWVIAMNQREGEREREREREHDVLVREQGSQNAVFCNV